MLTMLYTSFVAGRCRIVRGSVVVPESVHALATEVTKTVPAEEAPDVVVVASLG